MKVLTEYKRMQQSTTPWRTTHLQSQRNLLMKLTLMDIHPFQPLLLLPPRLLNPTEHPAAPEHLSPPVPEHLDEMSDQPEPSTGIIALSVYPPKP